MHVLRKSGSSALAFKIREDRGEGERLTGEGASMRSWDRPSGGRISPGPQFLQQSLEGREGEKAMQLSI